MSSELSTSPSSIISLLGLGDANEAKRERLFTCGDSSQSLNLEEFTRALPEVIKKVPRCCQRSKQNEHSKTFSNKSTNETEDDPIMALFRRLVLDKDDWKQFALVDLEKNYTRNLVSTDGETYTLLLLCWNPGKFSPIHDHPCDGCYMRVCEGSIREVRYEKEEETDTLRCIEDNIFEERMFAYINDFIGYHKIGNPSAGIPAITMHLYCPPFQKCQIWLDPCKASQSSATRMVLHSKYGHTI